jgi:peptidoglycan/xylan/chitin deacetylase (PgdA/CDA1 family)
MRLFRDQSIVSVMTFHSVGMNYDEWVWAHLTESAAMFESFLVRLRKQGYRTVSLQQLYDHMSGNQTCDERSVVLVFDDGYLDNWTTVAPLLKKYDMCGAVYVNPEFVDPGKELRPTIDDLGGAAEDIANVGHRGFMNWSELANLDRSGVLDVQSHSMSHTWYFTGPKIVDCHTPASAAKYPWMSWNARPERKPFYLVEDQSDFVAWGSPVFENEKSIIARRFYPEPEMVQKIEDEVGNQGGRKFFESPDWESRYRDIVSSIVGDGEFPGTYESEEDCERRVKWELAESKSSIEENLDKQVDFLCWPGGGVDSTAKQLALDVGYKSWTLPGGDASSKRNIPGSDATEVKRVPAMREVYFFGRKWGRGGDILMLLDVMVHQNSWVMKRIRDAYKLGVALGVFRQK